MNALREIRETSSNSLTIAIPKAFQHRMVEVIVLPVDNVSGKKDKAQTLRAARNLRFQQIFDESHGILPDRYKFDRDEAHAR